MAEQLQVAVSSDSEGVVVVAAGGELDAATSGQLERALTGGGMGSPGVKTVIADISGVEFIDSAGLGSILKAWKALRTEGIKLAVVSNRPRINRLFEISGLDQTFPVRPSIDEVLLDLGDD